MSELLNFINKRIISFKHAFNGIRTALIEEIHFKFHCIIAAITISAGIYLKINQYEWIALIICISLVLITEILNTSIENLANFVSPEKNQLIKKVKDLAAAAVLIASIVSVVVGLIIFMPKILNHFLN